MEYIEMKELILETMKPLYGYTEGESETPFIRREIDLCDDTEIPTADLKDIMDQDDPAAALWEYLCDTYADSCDSESVFTRDELLAEVRGLAEKKGIKLTDDDFALANDIIDGDCLIQPSLDNAYELFLNTMYSTNIFIDNGDANYDFILNTYGPHYDSYKELLPQAGTVWLAQTQGVDMDTLKTFLGGEKRVDSKFLDSLYEELENCSCGLPAVVFLARMSLRDIIKAQAKTVTITVKKEARCGLYDFVNGGGGTLDIELEKDVTIPGDKVFSVLPDGLTGCSILNTYGLCNSVYKTCASVSGVKEWPAGSELRPLKEGE